MFVVIFRYNQCTFKNGGCHKIALDDFYKRHFRHTWLLILLANYKLYLLINWHFSSFLMTETSAFRSVITQECLFADYFCANSILYDYKQSERFANQKYFYNGYLKKAVLPLIKTSYKVVNACKLSRTLAIPGHDRTTLWRPEVIKLFIL